MANTRKENIMDWTDMTPLDWESMTPEEAQALAAGMQAAEEVCAYCGGEPGRPCLECRGTGKAPTAKIEIDDAERRYINGRG